MSVNKLIIFLLVAVNAFSNLNAAAKRPTLKRERGIEVSSLAEERGKKKSVEVGDGVVHLDETQCDWRDLAFKQVRRCMADENDSEVVGGYVNVVDDCIVHTKSKHTTKSCSCFAPRKSAHRVVTRAGVSECSAVPKDCVSLLSFPVPSGARSDTVDALTPCVVFAPSATVGISSSGWKIPAGLAKFVSPFSCDFSKILDCPVVVEVEVCSGTYEQFKDDFALLAESGGEAALNFFRKEKFSPVVNFLRGATQRNDRDAFEQILSTLFLRVGKDEALEILNLAGLRDQPWIVFAIQSQADEILTDFVRGIIKFYKLPKLQAILSAVDATSGMTPLHEAARVGNVEIIRILRAGRLYNSMMRVLDPLSVVNSKGQVPYQVAVENHPENFELHGLLKDPRMSFSSYGELVFS